MHTQITSNRWLTCSSYSAATWSLLWACCLLLGCRSQAGNGSDSLVKEGDRLYVAYLQGNRDQARRCLLQLVEVGETAKLSPIGQARWLFFDYGRLYVLETRVGSQALADAYLVKARYWYLRQCELRGDSKDEASAAIAAFTAEKCMEFVDKWDRDHTEGKGPEYAQKQ